MTRQIYFADFTALSASYETLLLQLAAAQKLTAHSPDLPPRAAKLHSLISRLEDRQDHYLKSYCTLPRRRNTAAICLRTLYRLRALEVAVLTALINELPAPPTNSTTQPHSDYALQTS